MAKKFGSNFKKHLVKSAENEIKRVSSEFFNEVVERTPVDTGKAKNAWKVANEGEGKADVSNDVDYILRLNDGHSKQAPAGFIEQALALVKDRRK